MSTVVKQRFGYILKQAQHALRTRMDDELRAHELTTSQYAVLAAVSVDPGISNAALAKSAFVTAQTMQGIVATLEKRTLLGRAPDPNHGRILMTHLTENGRETLAEANGAVMKVEALMLRSITKYDQKRVIETLQTCIDNLALK